jgi:hypothetical protein
MGWLICLAQHAMKVTESIMDGAELMSDRATA